MQIIGGKHRKRHLKSPKHTVTRPSSSSVREALFNICQWEIENARFLDLFAGSGAIGLEALSRGASEVIFIENSRLTLPTLRENIALLKEESHSRVFPVDVFKGLEKLRDQQAHFTIIFADPPYGKGLATKFLHLLIHFPTC